METKVSKAIDRCLARAREAEELFRGRVDAAFAAYCSAHEKNVRTYAQAVADERDLAAWETFLEARGRAHDEAVSEVREALSDAAQAVSDAYAEPPSDGALAVARSLSMREGADPSEFAASVPACGGNPHALAALRAAAKGDPAREAKVPALPTPGEADGAFSRMADRRARAVDFYLNVSRAEADASGGDASLFGAERGTLVTGDTTVTFAVQRVRAAFAAAGR